MPREQAPDQQYQKGVNPDNLISDEEDTEGSEDTEFENTEVPPIEGERLAQPEHQQRPDSDIDQVEENEEEEGGEDESDEISQRP